MLEDAVPLDELRRALVVKLRHHGDVLLASPVFSALKAQAPHLEIDALVYDDTAPMLEHHPAIAHVHTVGRGWREAGFARLGPEWQLYRQLRSRGYDLIVHLSEHPRGAWLARTLGVRYAVAPGYSGRSRFWKRSFSHRFALPLNARLHMVEWNLDALRRIGVQPAQDVRNLVYVPGAQAEQRARELLAEHGLRAREFVHLHPASRWSFKCWTAQANAELIDRLAARGLRVLVSAAPDAEELALVAEIVERARATVVNLAGKLSVRELAALIGQAKLFVGVDSMPMHLAAALGTPVVALFGPSGEFEWGPWRVAHAVVASDAHPCRPCGRDGCGGGKVSECLTTLPVERVFAAAERLLQLA
ncbi:MAG: putative lipopolysaccharide heptosyltransferase III [Betaproteobacteria bacterium]|nr:putative lipopolysaccharide heptosyltransferase III [Betaproteobacteria bacterium]